MNIFESALLGLIQGLTEFLPVSSSGHLILAREILNLPLQNSLSFDILLHLATLIAIVFYFWGDISRIFVDAITEGLSSRSAKLVYAIILGSIPAAVVGFFWADVLENAFRTPERVAYALIIGSILFFIADKVSKSGGGISSIKGFLIGIFQASALIPGFSRSGMTIAGGLIFGLSREEAIRFAFLLGIPAILGASFKIFLTTSSYALVNDILTVNSLVGFLAALLSGFWAIRFLVPYLSKNSFTPFIIYRIILAILILILL